jgi:hypothetical protein
MITLDDAQHLHLRLDDIGEMKAALDVCPIFSFITPSRVLVTSLSLETLGS